MLNEYDVTNASELGKALLARFKITGWLLLG